MKAKIVKTFSSTRPESPATVDKDSKEAAEFDELISASDFMSSLPRTSETKANNFVDRAKYIPLRLNYDERKYLRMLEAALNVCEYTDKIDVVVYSSKSKRIVMQIKEICSILSGLVLAADYNAGQQLFKDRDFEHNADFFQQMYCCLLK